MMKKLLKKFIGGSDYSSLFLYQGGVVMKILRDVPITTFEFGEYFTSPGWDFLDDLIYFHTGKEVDTGIIVIWGETEEDIEKVKKDIVSVLGDIEDIEIVEVIGTPDEIARKVEEIIKGVSL